MVFNARDGMDFALLKKAGIITSESVELYKRRADKLHLDILESDCKDKLSDVNKFVNEYSVEFSYICYAGDYINNIEVIKAVGLGCCPKDAMPEVKNIAGYVAEKVVGTEVTREVTNIVLGENI